MTIKQFSEHLKSADFMNKIKASVIKKIIDRYENTTCPVHNEHPVISDIDIENNTFKTSFCCDVLKDMVKE